MIETPWWAVGAALAYSFVLWVRDLRYLKSRYPWHFAVAVRDHVRAAELQGPVMDDIVRRVVYDKHEKCGHCGRNLKQRLGSQGLFWADLADNWKCAARGLDMNGWPHMHEPG